MIYYGLLALAGFLVGYRFRMKGVRVVAIGPALLVVFWGLFVWGRDEWDELALVFMLAGSIPIVGLALLGAGIRRLLSGRAIR